ncbi:MmcQ/YjbR family DNA-binding protein [Aeromicrobium panaciterrae]|uniref:MmcQ/YjbR family DNA-binding protein n=1 Tax=Aeromicrobium panaciterrae TaxID=363861 RepID=UPI0031D591F1
MVTWDDVVALATALPEVEVTTSYGTPALKVAGKLMGRLRNDSDGSLALKTSEKEALVASDDPAYFTTPHYDGYAYVLVNLDLVDPAQLPELLDDAWHLAAPAKSRKQRNA